MIGNITYNIAQVGAYGYRVLLKDARACLCVQLFFSTVIGIFLFVLSDNLVHLFSITYQQKSMLVSIAKVETDVNLKVINSLMESIQSLSSIVSLEGKGES